MRSGNGPSSDVSYGTQMASRFQVAQPYIGGPLAHSQVFTISGRRCTWSTRSPQFSVSGRSARSRLALVRTRRATLRTCIIAR